MEKTKQKLLGKLPARSDTRMLLFANYLAPVKAIPAKSSYWKARANFAHRTFGNTEYGDCTRASQAQLSMRMERLEQKRSPVITDEEIIRVYLAMTAELYGGGDTGAYELDALRFWRNPEKTFNDTKGRPLTIDAFTRVNHLDREEMKAAIYLSGSHGIKICMNLPQAFSRINQWHVSDGIPLLGDFMPGSWGGHSMMIDDYDEYGLNHPTTWGMPDIKISWQALAAYCDEAYVVIDSVNSWKKKVGKSVNISKIIKDVNKVSSIKIA